MPGVHLKSLKQNEVENLLGSFETILSDCDGVLWIIRKPIKGVPETVKKLKESGKRIFYITNNPLGTRQEFSNQLQALGYEAKPEEVVCTAYLVATYLKSINFSKTVYLLGSESISRELDSFGISHIGGGPDVLTSDLVTTILSFVPDKEVGAVVVSLDEHISYPKLMKAATYLNNPNVLFIATSMDTHFPLPKGTIPGPGAIINCVEACSGRKPIILGKPSTYIKEAIVENFNIIPERTLFIGDSLHTDILTGKRCGMKTLLVLSGVTTEDDIKALNDSTAELIPDFYTDSLADIHQYL